MSRLLLAIVSIALAASHSAADEIKLRLNGGIDGKSKTTIDVVGLDPETLAALTKAKLDREQWTALFAVRVVAPKADENSPPVLGSYRVENKLLRFEPRFPLAQGVRYRATLDASRLPGRKEGTAVTAEFHKARTTARAATVVEQIYPTRNELPENLLRFYLHFSAPMSKGGAYRHIRLLAADGKPVERPFLELEEELWDPEGRRFTLLLDPGRIKRGLKPREELGPVLAEGKSYKLVIDRDWKDAEGNPLKQEYHKQFSVGPPDEHPIDPKKWTLKCPNSGDLTEREPLQLIFPKPLDHALLHRLIWVTDAKENKVAGTISVDKKETRWLFKKDGEVWRPGGYYLVIDKALEDVAGNNLDRPFEVDVFRPVQREIKQETVKLPFRINDSKELKPHRPD
jgi:hypothetical protein